MQTVSLQSSPWWEECRAPCTGRWLASCTWARRSSRPGCTAAPGKHRFYKLFVISLLRCSPDACQAPWQPHGHRGRDRRRWEPASGPGIFINYTFKYQIIAVSCGFEDMEHYHTSWMAVLMSMGPEAGAAAGASSPSTSDMMSSLMDRQGVKSETNQQGITYC